MMQGATSLELIDSVALCCGDHALVKAVDLEKLAFKGKFPKPPPWLYDKYLKVREDNVYNDSNVFRTILKYFSNILTYFSNILTHFSNILPHLYSYRNHAELRNI